MKFDVGQKVRHTNQWGDVLDVEFRGMMDSETAVVYIRSTGAQYSCKVSELAAIEGATP